MPCLLCWPRRTTTSVRRARALLALIGSVLLAPAVCAAEPPTSTSTVGAALRLSDVGCSRPDAAALGAFARAAQRQVVKYGETQSYPEEALRERLAGIVYLRLTYAANEDQPRVDVERSSGYPALDQYAIALAHGAAVRPPDPLRCRSFDIAFPLRFRVELIPVSLP
jgi:TonB family protein